MRLLALLRDLRDAGTAVVLISHDLPEVLEYANTITVLRDGTHIITAPAAEFTEESLIKQMIGRDIDVSTTAMTLPESRRTPRS